MDNFKRLSIGELCDKICENKKTLILCHVRPDADAIGSAFALRELLRVMDIPAICACADEVPDRLRFLTDGTQGSILLEEGMELDHERVISVDSASPSQLGVLYDRLHKYINLMIDHHASGLVYADNYVDPTASATGEIIYEVAKELCRRKKIAEIPHRVLNCVYAAILADTGCFKYSNATPKTLRLCAEILEAGIDRDVINKQLFESKSLKQVKAEGEAARRLNVYDGGKVASVTFPYSSKYSMSLQEEHLETIIDIPRAVAGVEVAFAVRQPADSPEYRVSMRSSGDVDVAEICASFGGGGHVRAAGCTVRAANIRDAEELVLAAIRKNMKNSSEISDIRFSVFVYYPSNPLHYK